MLSSRSRIGTLRLVISTAVVSLLVLVTQTDDEIPDPEFALPPSNYVMGQYKNVAVVAKGGPCAQIGVNVMSMGGNAVDASIATMLCDGVVCPEFMGLGGGFIMSYYDAKTKQVMKINAREMAPSAATEDMFVNNHENSSSGSLAIAVPGQLKGYWTIYKRFGGGVPWASLFEPTIQLLENGVEISKRLASNLRCFSEMIMNNSVLKQTFYDKSKGRFKIEGEVYTLPILANTMRTIANEGVDAFYNGSLTPTLLEDLKSIGSIITAEDLKNYTVNVTMAKPIKLKGGLTLHVGPPPGSSTILAYILRLLDYTKPPNSAKPASSAEQQKKRKKPQKQITNQFRRETRTKRGQTQARHNKLKNLTRRRDRPTRKNLNTQRLVEAFKFAYSLRTFLGDDELKKNTDAIYQLIRSNEHINKVRKIISHRSTSQDPSDYGASFYNKEDHGTDNIVVIDKWGNVVVVTSSLNTHFGSGYMSPSTDIFLNSQMDDFSTPGLINVFDVPPSPANFIKPGKRPMSSMCPSIFTDKNGDFVLGLGGAGGPKITLAVAYVSILYLWYNKTLKEAIDEPRIYHQLMPMEIQYEFGVTRDRVEKLKKIGHIMKRMPHNSSVTAIAKSPLGLILAMPDFRGKSVSAGN